MSIYVKDADGNRKKVAGIGLPGPAGKSAYQYAVEGGFTGTEDEFRALMGTGPWVPEKGFVPASNHNLLDNAYWASKDCIINQKGKEEYTGPGFVIDRWWASSGLIITLEYGWLKLHNPGTAGIKIFMQRTDPSEYDALVGSRATISVLYKCDTSGCKMYGDAANADGTTIQVIFPLVGLESDEQPHVISSTSGVISALTMSRWQHFSLIVTPGATVWFKAAKLELGSVQTLAHQDAGGNWVLNDPPPDKALELAKCQRYYQIFATQSLRPTKAEDFRPPMRVNPALGTIVIDGVTYYTADANL